MSKMRFEDIQKFFKAGLNQALALVFGFSLAALAPSSSLAQNDIPTGDSSVSSGADSAAANAQTSNQKSLKAKKKSSHKKSTKNSAKKTKKKANKKSKKSASSKNKAAKKSAATVAAKPLAVPSTELPLHVATQDQMVDKNALNKNAKVEMLKSTPTATSAVVAPVSTSQAATAKESPAARAWSASLSVGRTNSLYKTDSGEIQSNDFSASAGYKINDTYSVSAMADYSNDVRHPEDSDFGKALLGASRAGWDLFDKRAKLSPSLSLGLPVSKAQQASTFQTSIGATLKLDANPDYLFSNKLALGTGLGLSRSIHKYDTAESGKINTQYSSSQYISAGWSFTDALSLSGEIRHYNSVNYAGSMKEFYSHTQELGYAFNSYVAIALGHQYGSPYTSVWKDDSQNYNFNVIDEANSFVYGSVTLTVQ